LPFSNIALKAASVLSPIGVGLLGRNGSPTAGATDKLNPMAVALAMTDSLESRSCILRKLGCSVSQKPGFSVSQKPGFLVSQKLGFSVSQKPGFLKKPGFLTALTGSL
jgi:hypothetical protein